MWGAGHQSDVELVELFRVNIELDIGQPQIRRQLGLGMAEKRFYVDRSVIDVDVHINLLIARHDGGNKQSLGGASVSLVSSRRVLVQLHWKRLRGNSTPSQEKSLSVIILHHLYYEFCI